MRRGRRVRAVAAVRHALLAVVGVLVAGPLAVLLLTSITPRGSLPFQSFTLTLDNFAQVFAGGGTWGLLWNTLVYAGCSVAMALALAVGLAWLTERTDLPGRTLIRILLFSWMAVPPLVFGYGWILLINPGNGAVNVFLRWLFGFGQGPLTPYSIWALIGISGASLMPTAYIMIAGLLRNMDPVLEDAGLVLGASRMRVARRITAPLLTPGLLSVFIFLGMAMVQAFDLPLIVGMTARVPVLSTRIFLASSPDSGRAELRHRSRLRRAAPGARDGPHVGLFSRGALGREVSGGRRQGLPAQTRRAGTGGEIRRPRVRRCLSRGDGAAHPDPVLGQPVPVLPPAFARGIARGLVRRLWRRAGRGAGAARHRQHRPAVSSERDAGDGDVEPDRLVLGARRRPHRALARHPVLRADRNPAHRAGDRAAADVPRLAALRHHLGCW